MVFIALNVIFNAFILSVVLLIGSDVLGFKTHAIWYVSYAIVGSLALVGYSKAAASFVGWFISGRKMIGREKTRLEPLLSDVIERVNREYGLHYRLSDFKIKVTDNRVVNALAVGYNLITINRGVFEAFSDEQIMALLAHEIAHLYYRDSVRNIALIFSSLGARIVMVVYAVIVAIGTSFKKDTSAEGGIVVVLGAILVFIFLPIVLTNAIGAKVFGLLNMWMSRGHEYRADAFAASLGYKEGMITALEILDNLTVYDNSFLGKLVATHPSGMQRIDALEDEVLAKRKMGKLVVANPFNQDNAMRLGGNNEVIRLFAVILIFGAVWYALVSVISPNPVKSPVKNVKHRVYKTQT